MKKGIVVTGSLALDSIKTDSAFIDRAVGGSVIYFSHAARLFTPVSLVAVAGEDFPVDFLGEMNDRGIDVSNVKIEEGKKSFHWQGSYENDFNEAETLATELGVFADFNPQLTPEQVDTETLFLANVDPEIQLAVLEQTKSTFVGSDSMNLWINTKRDTLKKVLSRSNVVFMNETEGRLLTEKKKIFDVGRAVLDLGPDVAVIKLGNYGAALFWDEFYLQLPVYPTTDVVDPTGAGDSFAGGFMGYLSSKGNELNENNLRNALAMGTITASFNIEAFSLERLNTVTKSDIEARFNHFASLLKIYDK